MKKMMLSIALLGLSTLAWADSPSEAAGSPRACRSRTARSHGRAGQGHSRRGARSRKMHRSRAAPDQGRICIRRGGRQRRRHVPHCRIGWSAPAFFTIGGGKLGSSDRCGRHRSGHDHPERPWNGALAFQQVPDRRRCLGGSGTGWTARFRRYGLEAQYRNPDLLASQGNLCGTHPERSGISKDEDAMAAMYGANVSTRAVLHGEVPPPPAAGPFLHAVHEAKEQARAAQYPHHASVNAEHPE